MARFTPFVLSATAKRVLLVRNPLGAASDALSERTEIAGVKVIRIRPADQKIVGSRLETRRARLLRLVSLGYEDGVRALKTLRCDSSVD